MSPSLSPRERRFTGLLLSLNGAALAAVSILGPLFTGHIRYATSISGNYQIQGQDAASLFLFAPLFILGGILHSSGRRIGDYIVSLSPLFLFYYGLSMGIGMEWSDTRYSGNSERAFPFFLLFIVSGVILTAATLGLFSRKSMKPLTRRTKNIYTAAFLFFLLVFAGMWISEVGSVMSAGTSRGYDEAPTVFWVIRYLDLGISIPLAALSIYLLRTRPQTGVGVQMLLYGFFITMILSVNAMGLTMAFKGDGDFMILQQGVFTAIGIIVFLGYRLIVRNINEQ